MAADTHYFSSLKLSERLKVLREFTDLTEEELRTLVESGGLSLESADRMSENVVGVTTRPLGIIPGLIINGREYIIPLATEQSTIFTMLKKGVELSSSSGGFRAVSTGSLMRGQIQVLDVPDMAKATDRILARKRELLEEVNNLSRHRKAKDIIVRSIDTDVGPMLIVELLVDVKDSMGALIINAMCEKVTPIISDLTEGKVSMRVLSNLSTERLVTVETKIDAEALGGAKIVEDIVKAYSFAAADPYRAATHNKGIMNGVSSLLMATNNDTRAVEAGAHAYAALSGRYLPLSSWKRDGEGSLIGELEMPMAVGIIGGAISTHPTAKLALRILGVQSAEKLGQVAAATGLGCNLGALHVLVTDGVMSL